MSLEEKAKVVLVLPPGEIEVIVGEDLELSERVVLFVDSVLEGELAVFVVTKNGVRGVVFGRLGELGDSFGSRLFVRNRLAVLGNVASSHFDTATWERRVTVLCSKANFVFEEARESFLSFGGGEEIFGCVGRGL